MPNRPVVRFLFRPGRRLAAARRATLVHELRSVAAACFDEIPSYQVLSGDPAALDRAVIALARDPHDGRLLGFCSAQLLPVEGVGEVLHLGLTCVHPHARGLGLTHRLLSQLIGHYLVRHRPLRGAWFSNVASVLSSLGNVAMYFEDVHPSPYRPGRPSAAHVAIARHLSGFHRRVMHLPETAPLCEHRFVFRGANRGSVFAKRADDRRYHHRDRALTAWYAGLADLDRGDAVLQVGRIHLAGFARYALRSLGRRVPGVRRLVSARPTSPALFPERA